MVTLGRHFCKTVQWVLEEDLPYCEWIRKPDSTITRLINLRMFLEKVEAERERQVRKGK